MNKATLATAIVLASLNTQAMAFSLLGPVFQAGTKAATNLAGAAVDKVRGSGDKEKEAKEAGEARAKYEQQATVTYQNLPEEQRKAAIANAMTQYDKLHNFVAAAEAQQQAQRAQSNSVTGIASGFAGNVVTGAIGQKAMLDAAEASAKAGVGNRISGSVVNAASVHGGQAAMGGTLAGAMDKENQDKVIHMIDKLSNPGKSDEEIAAANAAKLKEVQENGSVLSKIGYMMRHNTYDSFKKPKQPIEPIRNINPDSDKEMAALMQQPAQNPQPAQNQQPTQK